MKQTIHAIGWSLIFLLGSLITQAQTTVLEGRVIDAGTGQGLAYVNIGLIGTSTGTVSDQEGNYYLEFPAEVDLPVRFSHVGYQSCEHTVALLQAERVVRLVEEPLDLPELIVRPWSEPKRYGSVRGTYRTQVNLALAKRPDQNLGAAIGRVFHLERTVLLDSVFFFVATNDFDSVTFRLQFYSVRKGRPDRPITTQPVLVPVTGQQRGWIKVPLRHLQIGTEQDVMVVLEWVDAGAKGGRLSLPVHFPAIGESHYYRYGAQNRWKRFRSMETPILLHVLEERQ